MDLQDKNTPKIDKSPAYNYLQALVIKRKMEQGVLDRVRFTAELLKKHADDDSEDISNSPKEDIAAKKRALMRTKTIVDTNKIIPPKIKEQAQEDVDV